MDQNDFKAEQQAAVQRMREMNSRRKEEMPPQNNIKQTHQEGFSIPFLDSFLKDGDSSLIIGLLLILMSEKADKMLLFALIYILI